MERHVRIASALNFFLGFWLSGTAVTLLNFTGISAQVSNEMIVGGLGLVLAGIRILNPTRYTWMSWANAALGAWLALAPFILSYSTHGTALTLVNDLLVGAGFMVFGIWSALATRGEIAP